MKKILAAIELLAVTSVFTVGFSSWTIVNIPSPETETVNVATEDVINISNYDRFCIFCFICLPILFYKS